jgi:hypothetical protein
MNIAFIIPDPAVVTGSCILMTASIFVGKLPCIVGLFHCIISFMSMFSLTVGIFGDFKNIP